MFTIFFTFFLSFRVVFSLNFYIDNILIQGAEMLQVEDVQHRGLFYVKTATRGTVWLLGSMYVLQACFGIDLSGIFAGLGVGGIALGLALQSTLKDFFASASIFLDRPFQVDDWINVNGVVGQVRWVGLRSTKLRIKGDGSTLTIPNSELANSPVVNYTEHGPGGSALGGDDDSLLRTGTSKDVARESSSIHDGELTRATCGDLYIRHNTPVAKLRQAKAIMAQAIEDQQDSTLAWVAVAEIEREGIKFSMRYDIAATDWGKFRSAKEEIHLAILEGLERAGISLVGPVQAVNVIAEAADPFAKSQR